MTVLIAALLIGQPAAPHVGFVEDRTASIFATVGHSEWCPAGNVRLDLTTGEYVLTPAAPRRLCSRPDLERPIRTGRLDAAPLAAIRSAYALAQEEGLDGCRDGGRPPLIIMNSGTPILVSTSGARTVATPSDHSCWSMSARSLHHALDNAFEPFRQR